MLESYRPVITTELVRGLIRDQFPRWADLPLRLFDPAGSDHVIHRLGDELAVRLPCHAGAIGQAEKELRWLPELAPRLPLSIPAPVAVGRPGNGYPWPWAVSRWLDGEVATADALGESDETALALAGFLDALQAIPAVGAPAGDTDTLAARDADTRDAIDQVAMVFDRAALRRVWGEALSAPGWDRPPVWFHGDFHTGNLLTTNGRVTAVIDFGGLGAGDPARDLMMAFTLMSDRTRSVFRSALGVGDATWARGRGWALTTGLNAYCSYAATNDRVAAQTTRQIRAVLAG